MLLTTDVPILFLNSHYSVRLLTKLYQIIDPICKVISLVLKAVSFICCWINEALHPCFRLSGSAQGGIHVICHMKWAFALWDKNHTLVMCAHVRCQKRIATIIHSPLLYNLIIQLFVPCSSEMLPSHIRAWTHTNTHALRLHISHRLFKRSWLFSCFHGSWFITFRCICGRNKMSWNMVWYENSPSPAINELCHYLCIICHFHRSQKFATWNGKHSNHTVKVKP